MRVKDQCFATHSGVETVNSFSNRLRIATLKQKSGCFATILGGTTVKIVPDYLVGDFLFLITKSVKNYRQDNLLLDKFCLFIYNNI